jgi:hypothetical protein
MVQTVLAQNGSYPECKSDIHELELLPATCPGEYRIGTDNNKLFLLKKDPTLIYGSYLIVDRRNYTSNDFSDKLKQLIELANK